MSFFRHLFTPTEENNYRAKALHVDFLAFYVLLAVVLSFFFKTTNILGIAINIAPQKLFALTNEQRLKNGLSSLNYNQALSEAAEEKAKDMFLKNYWAHFGPDGETPWDFILSSGYQYQYAGENLAKNFMFSEDVIKAWMNSKTHRENILRTNYSEVGFAVVNGVLNGEETTLVVQLFGKSLPKAVVVESRPENTSEVGVAAGSTFTSEVKETNKPIAGAKSETTLNLSRLPLNTNFIMLIFLILALLFDLYYAYKLKVIRVTGKHIAHFIFLGFILASLIVVTKGTIL